MAWFLTYFLIYVGTTVISALLAKTQRQENKPGDIAFPKADPDAPIPVIYGKTRVGMNVIYKANLRLGENTVRGSAPFGWSPQHIGYYYYLDLLAVLGWGRIDQLWDVIVDGDISLASVTPRQVTLGVTGATYTTAPALDFTPPYQIGTPTISMTVRAGDILGGKFSRGGVGAGEDAGTGSGTIVLQSGGGSVTHDTRLETLAGSDLPCYPNVATVRFGPDFYFGNSEQLPSFEFIVSRVTPWFSGTGYLGNVTGNSGNDALPGDILYDLAVNADYGMAYPTADIDGTLFNTVNNACDSAFGGPFDCGLSFSITERRSGKEIFADVLRTLDGVMYTHPTTGLLSVRLLRPPTDTHFGISGAPTIDESQIVQGSFEWSESATDATVNEVRVEFPDKEKLYRQNVATVRNVAAIQELGRVESRTVQFLGVTNADLAYRLAQRELRALSTSLGHASFEVDRSGYVYTPGQFFYLTYSPRGFSAKVMRVVSVRDTPHGKVAIDAVEDVYSAATVSYAALTPTEPSPPATEPFVAPYVEEYASQTTTTGTLTLFVFDPSGVVTSVEFQTTSGTGTPSGYAADAFPYIATVTLDPYATSAIDYRVNYTDQNGDAQTLSGSVTFGVDSDAAEDAVDNASVPATLAASTVPCIPFVLTTNGTLDLTTIPASATEITKSSGETIYRHAAFFAGIGYVRLVANVTAVSGTPSLDIEARTLGGGGSFASLVPLSITGTGLNDTGWVALDPSKQVDLECRPVALNGANTASMSLGSLSLYYLNGAAVSSTSGLYPALDLYPATNLYPLA